MQLVGRRYDTGAIVRLDITAGLITNVEPLVADVAASRSLDLPVIAPGLVDLQINGYEGQEFTDPELTVEKVRRVCLALDRTGVTGFCPTVTTNSFEVLRHALRVLAQAVREDQVVARRVIGFHVEGPYISTEDGPRGAHPKQHCRPPDWDEFQRWQEAAEGRIRILTMSPEYEGSPEFIRRVVDGGTVVAIGHTAASSDQIRAAVEAGASMSTHLGNGAHRQLPRHPNYLWDQLAEDRLVASLIVDGHHLPPAVVKTFVRAKTPRRCVLVSDITGMAGMPPGRYAQSSLGDIEVLEDGRLVIAGQRQLLAGASRPLTVGVATAMQFAGVDLKTAIEMASLQPLRVLGYEPIDLQVHSPANLIVFDHQDGARDLTLRATLNRGETVFGDPVTELK